MISLDTETTGTNFFHGSRPFFVTVCFEDDNQKWWEWNVNPLTREVDIPEEDAKEIRQLLARQHGGIVLQNAKFDSQALLAAGVTDWSPLWGLTHDTLLAGHLLASNQPHNLTDMSMQYLGLDLLPFEKRLEGACVEARRLARKRLPAWRIAKEGLPDMPSVKGSGGGGRDNDKDRVWKNDSWLPRAICVHCSREPKGWMREFAAKDHPWWTVLAEYGNADSYATPALWKVMEPELKRRDLWHHYIEKMRNLPALAVMETRGATCNLVELAKLKGEYEDESAACKKVCLDIASAMRFNLELPKGSANNRSLLTFCFEILKLPVLSRTETGLPSLTKDVMREWKGVLPQDSAGLKFIKNLSAARKRDKSVEFLDVYKRHGVPAGNGFAVIHPSINPAATDTTRFSMSGPNLQQVSKEETACEDCHGDGCDACGGTGEDLHSIRRVFGPAPGREWWSMDAKNIELRLPAGESGEPELVALFERPDDPPFYGSQHLLNASVVYQDVWEQELAAVGLEKVGPHFKKKYESSWYGYAKNGDFGMQYQCSEATADRAFHRPGSFRKLKSKFVRLDDLNRRQVEIANKLGYVETIIDRTVNPRRGYPLLVTRTDWGRAKPTQPLNYRTQGSAGWWMVKAVNRCHAQLLEWRAAGCDAWMVLTVHDELVFDFPARPNRGNLPKVRKLAQLMEEGGVDMGISTPVGISLHRSNWAEEEVI